MRLQRIIRALGRLPLVIAATASFLPFTPVGAEGLESSAATPHSVTLAWTAVGDDGLAGIATTYDIRYTTSAIDESNFNTATVVADTQAPLPVGSAESFKVTGLEPSTEYFFAIKVGDDAGNWSGLSNVISRTTASVLSAIVDLDAQTGPGNGQINLSWTDSPELVDTLTVRRYLIRYAETVIGIDNMGSAQRFDTTLTAPTGGQPQCITLTDLIPDQQYYLVVQVYDEFGAISPLSNNGSARASLQIGLDIDEDVDNGLPRTFEVSQNYPNPFNPATTIEYTLPHQIPVSIKVYNNLGRLVATLVQRTQPAGYHRTEWDASDDSGKRVASGVYFYRIIAGERVESRKMVLLK